MPGAVGSRPQPAERERTGQAEAIAPSFTVCGIAVGWDVGTGPSPISCLPCRRPSLRRFRRPRCLQRRRVL